MGIGSYRPVNQNWFYMVTNDSPEVIEERVAEFHRKYADIQMVIQGCEDIYFSLNPIDASDIVEKAADLFFLPNHDSHQMVTLKAGDFAIFFPGEVHKPMCIGSNTSEKIKKVVVKIPL
ncbi:YhcH/YjgK/YiaL family protein [Providencia vermicola]|uniref:YhcH/YjgK/YiaL family protein n=1 Tax=Providencia vermicola TaxID=333965 RepID=UPI0034E3BD1A